jgi:hypothetical protein
MVRKITCTESVITAGKGGENSFVWTGISLLLLYEEKPLCKNL